MRKKLTPIPKLVKKLDDVFQMYVRYRDDFTCCTCGRKFTRGERTQLHAGHYISRGVYATRWNEKNVNAQCAGCNLKQSLADVEVIHTYEVFLKTKYGDNVIDELLSLKHSPYKLNRAELEDKINYYTGKLNEFKKNN
jgi:hypothetical protein